MKPKFDDPTEGIWQRDNVHYPSGMTAFGSSVYLPPVARALKKAFADAGVVMEEYVPYWRSGEVYGRMLPVGGKEGPAPPWWVLAVVARLHPEMRRRAKNAERFVATYDPHEVAASWNDEGRARFQARIDALADVDLDALDDEALVTHLEKIKTLMRDGQQEHFRLFIPYVVGTHRFYTTAKRLLGWSDERILSVLAGSSMASAAPGRELEDIAARVRELDEADEVVAADDLIARLNDTHPELGAELAAWSKRWGLRGCVYDPGAPTLSEQPELMAGLVRDAIKGDLAATKTSTAAVEEAASKLSGGERRTFDEALSEAQLVFPLREDNVIYTDNLVCGLFRRTALAMGRRLVDRGQLRDVERAVELFAEELVAALKDGATQLTELAERRHAERMWVADNPGPNYLGGAPSAPPDMRGLPDAMRMVNAAVVWAVGLEYPEEGAHEQNGSALQGIAAWPGSYTGEVRIVRDEDDLANVRPGDVLVAKITVPAWSVVFPRIGALVTDRGGVLSHAAIVAREYGIPTVLSTRVATTNLANGQRVTVDGDKGIVTPC